MKKVAMLFSAVVLLASLTFAQTPQKKDAPAAKPADKKECTKEEKASCDHKTKSACTEAHKGGCCAKDRDAKKTGTTTTTPEKK